MKTYLIAHTDLRGHGIGQAKITAQSEGAAKAQFTTAYPARLIRVVGIKGQEG